MNTPPNDGGPAFPVAIMARQADGQPMTGCDFGVGGMTMRDYFASAALTGLVTTWYDRHAKDESTQRGSGPSQIAFAAYVHADAMLAERNKTP